MQFGPLDIVGAAMFAVYVLAVMEIFSLVVGGLILEVLWRRTSFNIVLTTLLGGFIAILPVLALLLQPSGNYSAWVDGEPTVIGGLKTSFGYWQDLNMLVTVLVFGAIGGASVWWFGKPKAPETGGLSNDR